MYNSSYGQAKIGLAAKNLRRSKERSCGYYMRVVLFFSSLIQSLIIVSLVLFLIYGEPQQTVEEKRIHELEQSYSRLSLENVALRAKEKNLTQQLNITLTAKKISETNLTTLRRLANISTLTINSLRTKWTQCELEKKPVIGPRMSCPLTGNDKYLEHRLMQAEELQKLLKANFTEQVHLMKLELESAHKDRIRYQLEGIDLRRDKTFLEERLDLYEKRCKQDFIQSLQGIPNVTKEFLRRVDDLFSKHISFQLTCDKQSIQLENIRANCSSLSTEVENKLQAYLDKVGVQVTKTIGENARCTTENKRLQEDATWCYRNRSNIIEENKRVLKQAQQNYDQELERLLLDVAKLTGNKKLQENLLSVKDIEIRMLTDRVKDLNTSLAICKFGQVPGGASSSLMNSFGQAKHVSSRPSQTLPFGAGSHGSGGTGSMGSTIGTAGFTGLGTSMSGSTSVSSVGPSAVGFSSAGTGVQKPGPPNALTPGSSGTGFSTGFGGIVPGGAGFASAASSSTGSNPAGASPFSGVRTTGGSDPLTAQINQHLRELIQYIKTD